MEETVGGVVRIHQGKAANSVVQDGLRRVENVIEDGTTTRKIITRSMDIPDSSRPQAFPTSASYFPSSLSPLPSLL